MLNEQQAKAIAALLDSGLKLEAVRRYREFTGTSLFVAKEHVGQIQRTGNYNDLSEAVPAGGTIGDEEMEHILDAIEQGEKNNAIKIYKDATGQSLRDSKEFVEKLMGELEILDPNAVGKTGCAGTVLIAIGLVFYFLA